MPMYPWWRVQIKLLRVIRPGSHPDEALLHVVGVIRVIGVAASRVTHWRYAHHAPAVRDVTQSFRHCLLSRASVAPVSIRFFNLLREMFMG